MVEAVPQSFLSIMYATYSGLDSLDSVGLMLRDGLN